MDPIGITAGDPNFYRDESNRPTTALDSSGLAAPEETFEQRLDRIQRQIGGPESRPLKLIIILVDKKPADPPLQLSFEPERDEAKVLDRYAIFFQGPEKVTPGYAEKVAEATIGKFLTKFYAKSNNLAMFPAKVYEANLEKAATAASEQAGLFAAPKFLKPLISDVGIEFPSFKDEWPSYLITGGAGLIAGEAIVREIKPGGLPKNMSPLSLPTIHLSPLDYAPMDHNPLDKIEFRVGGQLRLDQDYYDPSRNIPIVPTGGKLELDMLMKLYNDRVYIHNIIGGGAHSDIRGYHADWSYKFMIELWRK